MRPGVIECAFQGVCGRDPIRRTSEKTGRDWANFSVAVGDDDAVQWLDVVCFGPAVDVVMTLAKGDRVYCQGKISQRVWDAPGGDKITKLSVIAGTIQPLGKIGDQKPKATRKTTAALKKTDANAQSAAVNQPLPFDDELPI